MSWLTWPSRPSTAPSCTAPTRSNASTRRSSGGPAPAPAKAGVVGIFPNEASIIRLIGAVLLEQNDEWLLQHRYMQIEGMAELTPPLIDADPTKLPPMAA